MVSFTCENCGDILKEDVAQHVGECKGPFPLTCIHCKEEFYDDQYKSHTSCASKVPDVPEELTKPVIVENDNLEIKPKGEGVTKTAWMCAIDRLSQSPSLTPQQSTLLASLANLSNVPKNPQAFRKFANSRWKEASAHEGVVDEVFVLIQESMKGQEPEWLAALRVACRGRRMKPQQQKILDKVLSYQKHNPIPLSMPNQQSLQDLVRVVFKGSSFNPQMVNDLFAIIASEKSGTNGRNNAPGAKEIAANSMKDSKLPAEDIASKNKKNEKKIMECVVEIPGVDDDRAVEKDTSKKRKKKMHMRQENAVEEVDVPRKKSMKSA